MNYDIEAYLEGNLDAAERTAFEAELANNRAFREEVELQDQIGQHLKKQFLREEINKALAEDKSGGGKSRWGALFGIILLLLAGGYYLFQQKTNSVSSPEELDLPIEIPSPPSTPIEDQELKEQSPPSTPEQQKPPKEKRSQVPIAQNHPPANLPAPTFLAPNVRGTDAGNKEWIALINAIWYTDFPLANTSFSPFLKPSAQLLKERKFPRAYVQLQRLERTHADNDTLRYLKGYCLLEMGEGEEAIRYFENLVDKFPESKNQLEWYRSLANLISGKREKAVTDFKEIAASDDHTYIRHSKKALTLLQE